MMRELNDLEKSLSVLLSLYVMIEQNLNALFYYEYYLSNDSEEFTNSNFPDKQESFVDEAITESLWYQIILKSCSFLDEWDKMLGIKTEDDHKEKIISIKKVVKPARKAIDRWKDIRNFRNEIVAHNLRNARGELKLFSMKSYDCPQTKVELYYLVSFLNRMIRIAQKNLPTESEHVVMSMGKIYEEAVVPSTQNLHERSKVNELQTTLEAVDEQISNEVFSIVRYDILMSNYEGIKESKDGK